MDSIIALILFFATTLLPGLAVAQRVYKGNLYSTVAISFGIGTAIVSGELFFYFFIFRFPASSWLYIFLFSQALIALIYLWVKRTEILNKESNADQKKWKLSEKVVASLIGVVILFSIVQAATKPAMAYDAMVIWSLRAKILIRDGHVNFNPDNYYFLASPYYQAYPWHVSLSEYWLRQLGGGEVVVNFIPLAYFLGIILILYGALITHIGRLKTLIIILAFVSLPLIFYHSFNTYADLMLGYYIAVASFLFLKWLEKKETGLLSLSAFFIGWSFFVKNEGVFYIISWLIATGVAFYLNKQKISWCSIRNTLGALILPLVGWVVFKCIFNLGISDSSLVLQWHPQVFISFVYTLFIFNSWNVWWFIVGATIITRWTLLWKEKKWWPLWLFFKISFLSFIVLYFFTQRSEHALNFTAIGRTMIPLIILSVIFVGLAFKDDKPRLLHV